ncbi:hypothetical protein CAOG_07688 [Capsaspora owczarzaki ATCC 30864]|uniref:tRNA-uridine aminocarboxypropyltransferase 1 n=1 Tax=Capsaspora owczarzaki (strain ATCC 30864) TaxID=595528 RepID=A0A0D2X561_CAPO3|nr:hypothetical protein CAOG_07688 [Capsaspora owczarzaki ATCC 30864]KJE97249.1 hypothetical protein CAOG_007688 [Capsaspora owczarzaki ATCC 30864]|eukprot:XP_004343562.1 hypothetical protein CAOG_07688 [Capsaspora owczarzaki ATCC 30864]
MSESTSTSTSVAAAPELEKFPDWSPFQDLKIASHEPLYAAERAGRVACPKCQHKRLFFCFDCRIPLAERTLPNVELPLRLDIIKHKGEANSKSTAIHAAIIAPHQTAIYEHPAVPEDIDPTRTVLVFPSKDALTFEDLPDDFVEKGGRVMFIDSTWNQAHGVNSNPALAGIPRIKFTSETSRFWRHQKDKPATYLATIEAIHHFFRLLHERFTRTPYDGRYDNLLYFFSRQYHRIQQHYEGADSKKNWRLEAMNFFQLPEDKSKRTASEAEASENDEEETRRTRPRLEEDKTADDATTSATATA